MASRTFCMETLTLKAHFNGTHVVFDEPAELKPNAKLLVRVLPDGGLDPESEEGSISTPSISIQPSATMSPSTV